MKRSLSLWRRGASLLAVVWLEFPVLAGSLQLVTQHHSSLAPPAGGGGDSVAPVISPDGRYVLFASSAGNLVTNASGQPLTGPFPPKLNVFLRDRANGATTLVSPNLSGTRGGNGDSVPVEISVDGRYALSESSARDLVSNDTNNASDIFVRDLPSGITILVSANLNGGVGNGASDGSAMTPDGRYVAFVSAASDLVIGDLNGIPDIFVRDLQNNVTTLVSVGAIGNGTSASSSESPVITPDGRYVAFYSTAIELLPGVDTIGEIYLRDLVGGQTYLASADGRAIASSILGTTNIACYNHVLSEDGQYVAYEASGRIFNSPGVILRYSRLTGLTDTICTNAAAEPGFENAHSLDMTPDGRFMVFVTNTGGGVYIWDAQNDISTLVNPDLSSAAPTHGVSDWPLVDASGRYVAFFSSATNLTTNTLAGDYNLYVRDLQAATTVLVNADPSGRGSFLNPVTAASLSSNAQLVAFECQDSSLVPNDNNHQYDVFVRDLAAATNELISARHPTVPSYSANGPSAVLAGSVSTNGQLLAFSSRADDLGLNDTNGLRDIYLRDLVAGTNLLISVNSNGTAAGNGYSFDQAISGDGRYVVFTSKAGGLVAGLTNNATNVFVRDTLNTTTFLVSIGTNGIDPGNNASFSPMISGDGRYVLFHSRAQNLAPGIPNSIADNLYLRDLQAGTTRVLTTNSTTSLTVIPAAMTPDARYVVFALTNRTSPPGVFVYDSQAGKRISTNASVGADGVGISANGARIAFATAGQLWVGDVAAHTNRMIGGLLGTRRPGLRFSGDGRFLVYATTNAILASDANGVSDVYLYDFQTGTNLLISRSFDSFSAANGPSDSPEITLDGHFVAYRSAASNIVPSDDNGVPDVFLYDRVSGETILVTASRFGGSSANARSLSPVFSGDSQTLVLQSWGEDLTDNDYNQSGDLFTLNLSAADTNSSFYIEVTLPSNSSHGPTISWAGSSGKVYHVQFKDNLSDSMWQGLNANIVFVGNKAYGSDPDPTNNQRFYRIVLSN